MDNVKNDQYYAEKMRFDLNYIVVHMNGITRERFNEEEILQDAMMFRLIQISENAKKLTDEFKQQIDIPWIEVYGLRNRIVHEYGNVDLGIIYDTLTSDIPYLLGKLNNR